MMKILLVALNAKYIHSSLALRALRANLPDGYACEILDLTINNHPDEILSQIYRRKPDVLGLSCYIWNTHMQLDVADEIKKLLPHVVIIAGGPEASYSAEEILRTHAVDMVVTGEGEEVFARLAENGFAPAGVDGVAYLDGGCVCECPAKPPDPHTLHFAYADVASLADDDLQNKILYYESSRGCPFSCAYCMSSLTNGVRRRGLAQVLYELDALIALHPAQVKFVDRTFNSHRVFAARIWRHLIEHDNARTNFHFEIAGGLLDDEALALLKEARPGLFQFEIGVQSANPATLQAINRPNDLERLSANVTALIRGGNIHIHLDLIAGLPFEDMSSFVRSFDAVYRLSPHMLQLGFLKLLKGSPLRADAGKYHILYKTRAPYEVLSTPWLDYDGIHRLKRVGDAVEVYYNSGRFRASIMYLISFFESPFDFYDAVANTLGFGEGINRTKAQTVSGLYAFGVTVCNDAQALRDLIRFDLCLNEPPRMLPDWLRCDVPARVKKQMDIPKRGNAALEKFSYTVDDWAGGGALAPCDIYIRFDYGVKPVFPVGVNCIYRRMTL